MPNMNKVILNNKRYTDIFECSCLSCEYALPVKSGRAVKRRWQVGKTSEKRT